MGICQPPPDAEPARSLTRTSSCQVRPPSDEKSNRMSSDPKSHHTRSTTLTLKMSGFGREMVRPLEAAAPGNEEIVRIDARTNPITTTGEAFNLSPPACGLGPRSLIVRSHAIGRRPAAKDYIGCVG